MTPAPTRKLTERYVLGDVLGEGGQAVVHKAYDEVLGVQRAVKVLTTTGPGRASLLRRLRAEARSMARIGHPNILRIYDIGRDGDLDFVVMELADGGSLQDRVDQHGPLAVDFAVDAMVQVLAALSAAHAAGIVHRDVKPPNILIDAHGRALLADFGIAMLTGEDADRRTRAGAAMGSVAYMPPEQRLDASAVGISADIYAAGATLFSLVTGDNPVDLFLADADSDRWARVPAALQAVAFKATRQNPADRYATARDMAVALLAASPVLPRHPIDGTAGVTLVPKDVTLNPVQVAITFLEDSASQRNDAHPTLAPEPAADLADDPWKDLDPGYVPTAVSDDRVAAPVVVVATPPAPRRRNRNWLAAFPILMFLSVLAMIGWSATHRAVVAPATIEVPSPASPTVTPPAAVAPPPVVVAPTIESPPTPPVVAVANVTKPPALKPKVTAAAPDWTGTFGGRTATMELKGPDAALVGRVVLRFQGNEVATDVRGAIDRSAGTLMLEDQGEGTDLGTYRGTLSDEGRRVDGTFTRRDGRTVPFSFRRTP